MFLEKVINDIFGFGWNYGYESIRNSANLFKKNFSRASQKIIDSVVELVNKNRLFSKVYCLYLSIVLIILQNGKIFDSNGRINTIRKLNPKLKNF
ncbi:hypothetical protein HYE32_02865 [Mycoplasmopsis bovis]|nr:hypothetical protein [Mycoplasmopsis bovis]QQH22313.1 hypothetical protein HYE32_02865 [Mycoplasmopsis bovis]